MRAIRTIVYYLAFIAFVDNCLHWTYTQNLTLQRSISIVVITTPVADLVEIKIGRKYNLLCRV